MEQYTVYVDTIERRVTTKRIVLDYFNTSWRFDQEYVRLGDIYVNSYSTQHSPPPQPHLLFRLDLTFHICFTTFITLLHLWDLFELINFLNTTRITLALRFSTQRKRCVVLLLCSFIQATDERKR